MQCSSEDSAGQSSGRYNGFLLFLSIDVSEAAAVMMRRKRFFAQTVREELATSAHTLHSQWPYPFGPPTDSAPTDPFDLCALACG